MGARRGPGRTCESGFCIPRNSALLWPDDDGDVQLPFPRPRSPQEKWSFCIQKNKKTGKCQRGKAATEGGGQEHGNRGGGRVEVILDCQEEGAEVTIIIDGDTRRQVCACSQAPGLVSSLLGIVFGARGAGRSDGGGVGGGHDGYALSYLAPPLPARSPSFSTCSATSSSRSSSITTRVGNPVFPVFPRACRFVRDVLCSESSNFVF